MTDRELMEREGFILFSSVRTRLGAEFWQGRADRDVEVLRMASGAVWIRSDDLHFFFYGNTGEPVACRRNADDDVDFAWITPQGEWLWGRVPEPIGSLN